MTQAEKIDFLEQQVSFLTKMNIEFFDKALLLLSLSVKTIYSKEEAACFLNLDPDYLYQLKYHNKIKAYKKKGQKKIYFKKEDLENYILSDSDRSDKDYSEFEEEITNKWKK